MYFGSRDVLGVWMVLESGGGVGSGVVYKALGTGTTARVIIAYI